MIKPAKAVPVVWVVLRVGGKGVEASVLSADWIFGVVCLCVEILQR